MSKSDIIGVIILVGIVVVFYLIHRYQKNKNKEKTLPNDAVEYEIKSGLLRPYFKISPGQIQIGKDIYHLANLTQYKLHAFIYNSTTITELVIGDNNKTSKYKISKGMEYYFDNILICLNNNGVFDIVLENFLNSIKNNGRHSFGNMTVTSKGAEIKGTFYPWSELKSSDSPASLRYDFKRKFRISKKQPDKTVFSSAIEKHINLAILAEALYLMKVQNKEDLASVSLEC